MNQRSISRFFLQVTLCLTIIALCIAVVINFQPLYYLFVKQEKLAQVVGLSQDELLSNYRNLLNYLNFPWVSSLGLTLPSSASGLTHFADVKRLFMVDYVVLLIGAPFSYYYLRQLKKRQMFWELISLAQLALAAGIIVAVTMALSFQQFFIAFHKVLFRNNDWIFDPAKDPIINALPDEFFLACFVLFFILFIVSMVILYLLGKHSLKPKR